MRALVAMLLLLLVNPLAPASAAIGGQEVVGEPAIVGYVLAPDGTPVSGGAVVARSGFFSTSASIDGTGRFRLVPRRTGPHQRLVTVPGLPPHRAALNIPDSSPMRLPALRLVSRAYFRVRLL